MTRGLRRAHRVAAWLLLAGALAAIAIAAASRRPIPPMDSLPPETVGEAPR